MKLSGLVGAAFAAMVVVASTVACSASTDATEKGRCTPGAYVFCRCAGNRAEGTKLCKEDGNTFEACTTGGGECIGGEDETDPRSGEPVDPPPTTTTDSGAPPTGAPGDACPGKPIAVTQGPDIVIEGDTTGAADDFKGRAGACATGAGGPDHVYALTAVGGGALTVKVQGTGAMNPVVYLRRTCADEEDQAKCAAPLGAGATVTFDANIKNGVPYYLVVDGASGSAGKYKITLSFKNGPFCGDGKVDANEACDDGNNTDGDGCNPACQQVNGDPTTGNGCAAGGHPVDVWPGRTVTGTGTTNPYGNAFTKTGSSCTVSASDLNAAQDHIYAVTPHATGNLKVTLTPSDAALNMMLVARATCTDPNSQGANMCANNGSAGAAETMTFPVQDGKKVYVAAEGVLTAKGAYTIKFEMP